MDVAVDGQGDLFVAPGQPGLGRIARATTAPGVVLPITSFGAGTLNDIEMVSGRSPAPSRASSQEALAITPGRASV